jgi:hypothetical protein
VECNWLWDMSLVIFFKGSSVFSLDFCLATTLNSMVRFGYFRTASTLSIRLTEIDFGSWSNLCLRKASEWAISGFSL